MGTASAISGHGRVALDYTLPWARGIFGTHAFITAMMGAIGLGLLIPGLGLSDSGEMPQLLWLGMGLGLVALTAFYCGVFVAPGYRAIKRRDTFVELHPDGLVVVDPELLVAPFEIPADAVLRITPHVGRVLDRDFYMLRAPAVVSTRYAYYPRANAKVALSRAVPVPRARSRFLNKVMVTGEDLGIKTLYLQLSNPDDVKQLSDWMSGITVRNQK